MGAVFAVQVRTGAEMQAKEMIKHVLKSAKETIVKGIYSTETYTEIVNKETESVSVSGVDEHDIELYLTRKRYSSAINNRRQQLDVIADYNTDEYNELKIQYKKEIRNLEKQVGELRKEGKLIHSVLSGYLLVELNLDSHYLPDQLWHLLKSVPLVQNIFKDAPIPEHEMEGFISNIGAIAEPEVIITFDEEEVEIVAEKVSDLLHEANKDGVTKEEQLSLFEEIDELQFDVIKEANNLIEEDQFATNVVRGVKAFIARKKETIKMPLRLLRSLYGDEEVRMMGKVLNKRDFVQRLRSLVDQKVAMVS